MKKILIEAGSCITHFYGICNLISVILMLLFPLENISRLAESVLTLDVLTWHIFCVVSICAFVGKVSTFIKEKQNKCLRKYTAISTVLHFCLMLISFSCIVYFFRVGF